MKCARCGSPNIIYISSSSVPNQKDLLRQAKVCFETYKCNACGEFFEIKQEKSKE